MAFVGYSSTATITAGNTTVVINNALANSTATNSVQVIVTDVSKNVVPNAEVSFEASNGATIDKSAKTNADGEVLATLTNIGAGYSEVTATINRTSQKVTVYFTIPILLSLIHWTNLERGR